MRYTGHLDLHRTWERAFRRARLPLAYSQGFHPQPRLNLACALPLGFTSECEVLDVWFNTALHVDEIIPPLNRSLPPGIVVNHFEPVDLHLPSLQTQVLSAGYVITLLEPFHNISAQVTRLLNSEHLPRQWRNRPYDLRPLIEALGLDDNELINSQHILLQMAAREGATGRPEEVLEELAIPFEATHVHRVRLIFKDNYE